MKKYGIAARREPLDVPDDRRVRERVLRRRGAGRAEDLDPLVVAVDGLAAVVDHRQAAVLVREGDHRGVDVAELAQARGDADAAGRVDLGHLAAGHVARHVEVVHGHVEEQPARDARVLERRRRGIPARDAREVRLAQLAGGHGIAHGLMRRIEAAVEADLERHAGRRHRGERPIDLGEIERHGLLAQDRLAGACGLLDQRRMRRRARADRDRLHVLRGQELVDGLGHVRAELGPDRLRRPPAPTS